MAEEEFLGALYKGGELLAAGKIVEAREHLEKAHELSPKNEKAQNLLGLAYFKLGLFDQASHVYELLVRENPADPTLRVNLGLVYLKTNDLERAVREFETATDLEPGHKKAHNYLGLALAQQGEYGKARDHFIAAGSDQMAEKMDRALAARAGSPSNVSLTVPSAPPPTALAVTGAPAQALPVTAPAPMPLTSPVSAPPLSPPPAAHEPHDEAIEVMSDDELPPDEAAADVELEAPPPPAAPTSRASQPSLHSDWGAQLPVAPAPAPEEELRFADDEGPPALPMNDAPLLAIEGNAEPLHVPVEPLPEGASSDMPILESEAVHVEEAPHEPAPEWLTTEAREAEAAAVPASEAAPDGGQVWVTETVAEVPLTSPTPLPRPSGELPIAPTEETWAQPAPANDGWQAPALEQVITEPAPEAQPAAPEAPAATEDWSAAPQPNGYEAASTETDFSSASGNEALDSDWVAQPLAEASVPEAYAQTLQDETYQQAFEDPSVSGASIEQYAEPSASDWEQHAQAQAQTDASAEAAPLYDSPPGDPLYEPPAPAAEAFASEPQPEQAAVDDAPPAFAEELPQEFVNEPPAEPQAEFVSEAPSAFVDEPHPEVAHEAPIQLDHPVPVEAVLVEAVPVEAVAPATEEPRAFWEQPAAPLEHAPEGAFAPMDSQRLVDLGASAGWVQEASESPFQLGPQGLAVTVAGELLVRMTGLVAVVGSVKVAAETRRKRGRPTQEPFGTGPSQLQRVTGNGVLYLEAGRSRFHSVDLTDQPGSAVDDEGAYLREELLFAFEEVVSFENGRLAGEGSLSMDLVHLKGRGRVLLQLEGSLKAMAIPPGAPMVVPLHRLVGWFGRVTPRLMGFGGQGAVELTGDGFALLGTPSTNS